MKRADKPIELPPEVRPGQSIGLLQELHILTRDGKLNQDSRRKLKQVYHLYQFIEPLLKEVLAAHGLKMPQMAMPLRLYLTGQLQTPAIDAVLETFGRETVVARLRAVA